MAVSLREGRAVDGVQAIAERPNGTRVWFTPYPRPLHDAQGRIVGGINMLLDITERKQAERANSLLAAIVSSSDDAIVSKTLDGIITSWNKGAERVFGFTAEEAVGQGVTLIIPPDRRDEETEILNRLRRGERVDHFETVRQCKDGTLLDISLTISPVKDATGRVIGASKVARDITERKRAERALSEQARLLDLSNDAIIVREAADRITYWNKAATELYGYTSEEALGRVTHKLLQTEFPAPLENINEQLHRDERWSGELAHTRKDGTKVIVVSRWVLDRKTYGNAWCVLETNNDITQQKWAEKRLRESEERYRKLSETLDAEVRARTKELEERNVDVLRQSQAVRDLSWRLLHMQDEERRHIARELHDSAGQLIAALQMNLIPLEPEAQKVSPDFADSIKLSLDLVGQLSKELRTVSHLLHPPLLDEAGLGSAIRWFVEGFGERSHIDVQLELSPDLGRLSREMEITVFRIIQECLTNIHRHANCDRATIRVSRSVEQVLLAVQDNGNGKGNKGSKNGGNGSKILREGVGIQGMRQRVKQLGGSFEIRFAESGTLVTAIFPLQVPKGQDAQSAPESYNTVAPV
jgi:PAS domain S-box-containing protein